MTLELPKAEEKGKIKFKYPVIKDPHQLEDNYRVVVKMATKPEYQYVATLPVRGVGEHRDDDVTEIQSVTKKMTDL